MTATDLFPALTVVLAAAVAASLLALAGPDVETVTAQEGASETEISATGLLTEAPPTAPSGTFFMIDDLTGTAHTLRSDELDLGAYTGRLVTVFGTPAPEGEEPGATVLNVSRIEPIEGTGPFTVTFELTVEGEPPADATFFGLLGSEPVPMGLTDPDGDGVYTATTPPGLIPNVDVQPARIVQGTGTRPSIQGPEFPGDPVTVIRDFGAVVIDQDLTLPAHLSFADSTDPPRHEQPFARAPGRRRAAPLGRGASGRGCTAAALLSQASLTAPVSWRASRES